MAGNQAESLHVVSYIYRTRNRPHRQQRTLGALSRTHTRGGSLTEVIVVDDGSQQRLVPPRRLPNGVFVRAVALCEPAGHAAFNAGADATEDRCDWLVLLADDACPTGDGFAASLRDWDQSIVAVMPDQFADARAGRPAHRAGRFLPEALPTSGFGVRRDAFLRVGGFTPGLTGPAAAIDLSARLMEIGTVVFDPRFQVVRTGRKAPTPASLLRQLRDAAGVLARVAPPGAHAEHALFMRGMLPATPAWGEGRRVMTAALREMVVGGAGAAHTWDRLTGLHAARTALSSALARRPFVTASIVEVDRHEWVVRRALDELGVSVVDPSEHPDALVVGSVSPPCILEAMFRLGRSRRHTLPAQIVTAWNPPVPARAAAIAA